MITLEARRTIRRVHRPSQPLRLDRSRSRLRGVLGVLVIRFWGHQTICSKSPGNGARHERASPFTFQLPLGRILEEDSESKKSRKSVIRPIHAQTNVYEMP
jgi:hypothetical protein